MIDCLGVDTIDVLLPRTYVDLNHIEGLGYERAKYWSETKSGYALAYHRLDGATLMLGNTYGRANKLRISPHSAARSLSSVISRVSEICGDETPLVRVKRLHLKNTDPDRVWRYYYQTMRLPGKHPCKSSKTQPDGFYIGGRDGTLEIAVYDAKLHCRPGTDLELRYTFGGPDEQPHLVNLADLDIQPCLEVFDPTLLPRDLRGKARYHGLHTAFSSWSTRHRRNKLRESALNPKLMNELVSTYLTGYQQWTTDGSVYQYTNSVDVNVPNPHSYWAETA